MTKTILIVDDDPGVGNAVKYGLESLDENYKVIYTDSGKKCLELLDNNQIPNIILLDIMLPDMSGWDIYEKLKTKKDGVHFAFLSAIPVSSERMQELKNAGVSDYITKPFTKADLIERIKRMTKK